MLLTKMGNSLTFQALLDWGFDGDNEPAVSPPNRDLVVDRLMGGAINVVLRHQERGIGQNKKRLGAFGYHTLV